MKNIIKLIRRWHYRRIFRRWYKYFIRKGDSPSAAFDKANEVFFWLACCEYYPDWYAMEYYGVSLSDINPSDQPHQCKCSDDKAKLYKPVINSFDHLRETVEYPEESLTLKNHRKNLFAFKILKIFGFSLHPTWNNSEKGGLLYFSASALPLRWKSPLEA